MIKLSEQDNFSEQDKNHETIVLTKMLYSFLVNIRIYVRVPKHLKDLSRHDS